MPAKGGTTSLNQLISIGIGWALSTVTTALIFVANRFTARKDRIRQARLKLLTAADRFEDAVRELANFPKGHPPVAQNIAPITSFGDDPYAIVNPLLGQATQLYDEARNMMLVDQADDEALKAAKNMQGTFWQFTSVAPEGPTKKTEKRREAAQQAIDNLRDVIGTKSSLWQRLRP
jgi:hypothetical protein